MSVILETTLGTIIIDLYTEAAPTASKNFLKLCKIKYYNNCLFHNIQKDFVIQTGDPTNTGKGGESIYYKLFGEQAKYFEDEIIPTLKHTKRGTVGMASAAPNQNGSQFYITCIEDLHQLDEKHTIFGVVAEGLDVVSKINEVYTDSEGRPLQVVRIKHTIILEDPFPDPPGLEQHIPDSSPLPPKEQWDNLLDEEEMEKLGKPDERTQEEIDEAQKDKEAKSREDVLVMVQDIPDYGVKPPDNVLFVCKLNPATTEEDLELIFSRFGEIKSCEVIKDWKTHDSLCYAFIEFANRQQCEDAYFKMDNVLIDDRRIHVDFSQSVSKLVMGKEGKAIRLMRSDWKTTASTPRSANPRKKTSSSSIEIKDNSRTDSRYDMVFEEDNKRKRSREDYDRKKPKQEDRHSHHRSSDRDSNHRHHHHH